MDETSPSNTRSSTRERKKTQRMEESEEIFELSGKRRKPETGGQPARGRGRPRKYPFRDDTKNVDILIKVDRHDSTLDDVNQMTAFVTSDGEPELAETETTFVAIDVAEESSSSLEQNVTELEAQQQILDALSVAPSGTSAGHSINAAGHIVDEGEIYEGSEESEETYGEREQQKLISKDDPKAKLHYLKIIEKDGRATKVWECGICGKDFRHQYTLARHLPTHTDERNFKCNDCGRSFRQMSTLTQHKATHSTARPYICDICQKTFNRVSTLISHRKIHNKAKEHTCPHCNKGFHQKGNLQNHIYTHTNARPFKCDLCGQGFNQQSNLIVHRQNQHKIDPFSKPDQPQVLPPRPLPTKGSRPVVRRPSQQRSAVMSADSAIIIDAIQTQQMQDARDKNQTAFALLKPAKGIPVLVKVLPAPGGKNLLVPANPEDLKGQIDPPKDEKVKSVQVKVPVVATVIQKVDASGKISIEIQSPGNDDEEPPNESNNDQNASESEHLMENIQYIREDGTIITQDELQNLNETTEATIQFETPGGSSPSSEEIHYVRRLPDGSYEIVNEKEASEELMLQQQDELDGALNVVTLSDMAGGENIIIDQPMITGDRTLLTEDRTIILSSDDQRIVTLTGTHF